MTDDGYLKEGFDPDYEPTPTLRKVWRISIVLILGTLLYTLI